MNYHETTAELTRTLDSFFAAKSAAVEAALEAIVASLRSGGKILLFGNGGSAAEAQHFAAELVNKFGPMRRALAALALTTDTSALTAIGNDIAFDKTFSRQIEALGRAGDVAIGLTTSGASANVVEGLKAARAAGLKTIAMTGERGGQVAEWADILLDVPSRSTARIQEVHLVVLHLLAGGIDERLAN
jgi:D-sedoheptulose 7-phosphate isomerase